MMARLIRAHMLRVIEGDLYDLREFYELRAELDAAIQTAIERGRQLQPGAWSWTNIGDALGVSRQAAQQRWGVRVTRVIVHGAEPCHEGKRTEAV